MATEQEPGQPDTPRSALETSLRGDIALAKIQDDLVRAAKKLFDGGYGEKGKNKANISPAQMSGVAEQIRRGQTLESAQKGAEDWLKNRLERLQKKKDRSRKVTAWLKPFGGEDGAPTLGHELIRWIREQTYLPEGFQAPDSTEQAVRLLALRRFWALFHAQHRYQDELGEPMSFVDPASLEAITPEAQP